MRMSAPPPVGEKWEPAADIVRDHFAAKRKKAETPKTPPEPPKKSAWDWLRKPGV